MHRAGTAACRGRDEVRRSATNKDKGRTSNKVKDDGPRRAGRHSDGVGKAWSAGIQQPLRLEAARLVPLPADRRARALAGLAQCLAALLAGQREQA